MSNPLSLTKASCNNSFIYLYTPNSKLTQKSCLSLTDNNRASQIRSFRIESILSSKHEQRVNFVHHSKGYFHANYQDSFLVLPDGKTIIGVDGSTSNALVAEDVTLKQPVKFARQKEVINTLLYDPETRSLFAGDLDHHVVQYQRGLDESTFSIVKDYGDVDVGCVLSLSRVGGLLLVGGNDHEIVGIDIANKQVLKGHLND